jgi:opacity protein-like surface antigen
LGWERPLSDRLSLRGEYLYSNFGSETLSDPVSGATTKATPTYHRVGLALIGRF